MVWPSFVAFSVTEFFSHNALLCNVDVDVKGGLGVKEKPDYPNAIVHRCTFPFPTENELPSCLRLFVFLLLRPYCVRPYCSSVLCPSVGTIVLAPVLYDFLNSLYS